MNGDSGSWSGPRNMVLKKVCLHCVVICPNYDATKKRLIFGMSFYTQTSMNLPCKISGVKYLKYTFMFVEKKMFRLNTWVFDIFTHSCLCRILRDYFPSVVKYLIGWSSLLFYIDFHPLLTQYLFKHPCHKILNSPSKARSYTAMTSKIRLVIYVLKFKLQPSYRGNILKSN